MSLPKNTSNKLCQVKGKEGDFYILRKGAKNVRVTPVSAPDDGFLVVVADLENEREVPKPSDPIQPDPIAAITDPS